MTQLILPIATALLLLGALFYWAVLPNGTEESAIPLPEAFDALRSLESQLLPVRIVERIFDPAEHDFVKRYHNSAIERLFMRERTALAISWLRQTERLLSKVIGYHRSTVRRHADVSPAAELKIAVEYLLFIAICRLLIALIWLRGPFQSRRIVSYARRCATALCQTSVELFSGIEEPEAP
jgi:hypothetical protein